MKFNPGDIVRVIEDRPDAKKGILLRIIDGRFVYYDGWLTRSRKLDDGAEAEIYIYEFFLQHLSPLELLALQAEPNSPTETTGIEGNN